MDRLVTTIAYFILIYRMFCAEALENVTHKRVLSTNLESAHFQKKWVTELFHEAKMVFQMDSGVSDECKRDFNMYKLHLRNQSVWAVRMLESSEWPSVGIFSGTQYHLGNYDECVKISAYNIEGQYCLAETTYHYPDTLQNEIVEVPDEKISAWDALTMYQKNPVRVDRRVQRFAICVPSSCKSTDLIISLNSTLYPIFQNHGLNILVNVDPIFCETKKTSDRFQEYFIAKWIFVAFFLLLIYLTYYDVVTNAATNESKKDKPNSLLENLSGAVSLVGNYKKLVQINTKSNLVGLDFIKVFNMLLTIYGHRYVYSAGGCALFNTEQTEQMVYSSSRYGIEITHTNVVDVFFMVSGFLTFHSGVLPMIKGGWVYIFIRVLSRWLRTVPIFSVLMLYIIFVLPYTSEGPLWNYKIMTEVNNCKKNFWTNLLGINNIVKTNESCLIFSWYIAADVQLAVLGAILLFIYAKNNNIGILAILFSFVAASVITFAVAYANHFHGIMTFYISFLQDSRNYKEFVDFYIVSYPRMIPYLMGIMTCLLIKIMKGKQLKISDKQIYLISFSTILIGEGGQYYGRLFYAFGREYSRLENALYATAHRMVYVFIYVVHLFLFYTSGLGIFTKFFQWNGWIILGRLTYSVYLVNTVIQLYHVSSQQQPMSFLSRKNLVWWTFGDIIWSYIIGFILYMCFEAPIFNLSQLLLNRLTKALVKPKTDEVRKEINSKSISKTNNIKNE